MTWVVGAGGLLGRAVTQEVGRRGDEVLTLDGVPWADPDAALAALSQGALDLVGRARSTHTGWRVVWSAGSGVTGTSEATLVQEVELLRGFLDALGRSADGVPGSVFLASSAGGLYAGSPEPPYTESHPTVPISPYGHAKVRAEDAVRRFGETFGVRVLIGRIANLYGPGQNLAKPQGLISHLCRASLSGQPVSIYVSLDTVRDYLFVQDCAAMVIDGLDALESVPPGTTVTKIFASHQGTTIGALIGECRRVFKQAPRVVLGSSPSARFQTRDLRLRSRVWPVLDHRALTPLPVGLKSTWSGLLRDLQRRP